MRIQMEDTLAPRNTYKYRSRFTPEASFYRERLKFGRNRRDLNKIEIKRSISELSLDG